MGGHATHDEREARETFPTDLFEYWGAREPVGMFEAFLVGRGVPSETLQDIEDQVSSAVDKAADEAKASKSFVPTPDMAVFDGFSLPTVLSAIEKRLKAHG